MHDFIEKLRGSEEYIKRRWLFLISGISMVVIVFLWIKYFNLMVAPSDTQPQQAEQNTEQSFTFWDTFKAGLGTIMGTAEKTFNSIINTIRQPKSYDIKK
ncbi:MAG TPA: hypothetical protein VMV71_03240 [Candidatus Paceibacterota bacterium]|nr:hypothetical protein [Candidatus Paceibacterota bacterium]